MTKSQVILFTLYLAMLLSACGGTQDTGGTAWEIDGFSAQEVADNILAAFDAQELPPLNRFFNGAQEGSESFLEPGYTGVLINGTYEPVPEMEYVSDFAFFTPSSYRVFEVIVLKVADNKNTNDVKAILEKRLAMKDNVNVQIYTPEEVPLIQNAMIAEAGSFVFLLVTHENTLAMNAIEWMNGSQTHTPPPKDSPAPTPAPTSTATPSPTPAPPTEPAPTPAPPTEPPPTPTLTAPSPNPAVPRPAVPFSLMEILDTLGETESFLDAIKDSNIDVTRVADKNDKLYGIVQSAHLHMRLRNGSGANWGSYLLEPKNSIEVMFFGSSLAYCNIRASILTQNTGISAYALAGPEQTLPMTYYYVREAFETQSPNLVFVEVTGMYFPRHTTYGAINIEYMPWSINRVEAALKTMPQRNWLDLVLPFHSRWDTMDPTDVNAYTADANKGYTYLGNIAEVSHSQRQVSFNQSVYDENLSHLHKIARFCESQGSKVVFFIAPSFWPWQDEYRTKMTEDILKIENASFVDFNDYFDQLGIDPKSDFHDRLHFNHNGARKFTEFLSDYILGIR